MLRLPVVAPLEPGNVEDHRQTAVLAVWPGP